MIDFCIALFMDMLLGKAWCGLCRTQSSTPWRSSVPLSQICESSDFRI